MFARVSVGMRAWPLLGAVSLLFAGSNTLEQARKLYSLTEYNDSLHILQSLPDKTAPVYELMGQNYYGLGDFKKATENLEKAVAADPSDARSYNWLGKAYGRRAETSSPFTAPGYASKARQAFEKAVQLDPKNLEAVNDLFEYYLEAPGFLGGGMEKANQMAAQIAALDAAEGNWARARIAEKRKEFSSAEQHLRRAAEIAPQQVGRVLDLAKFLAKQGRYQESDKAFETAKKIAPQSPKVLFAQADTYIKNGRNLETARKLLEQYIASTLTPDDPPRSEAEKLLKQTGS
jgi:tetratricopeptide (TPR) repeat protein